MAEKIISPGVFTKEIDQTFLPSAVADIGAALIGPTVKGPAGIPTVVTSYGDFQNKFGDVFKSGSNSYQYLTSHTAEQYLRHSDTLTVIRIMDGEFSNATAIVSSSTTVGSTFGSASLGFAQNPTGSLGEGSGLVGAASADTVTIGGVVFHFMSSSAGLPNDSDSVFLDFAKTAEAGSTMVTEVAGNLRDAINGHIISGTIDLKVTASIKGGSVILSGSQLGTSGNITITTGSALDTAASSTPLFLSASTVGNASLNMEGGVDATNNSEAFVLRTLADGSIMNNAETGELTNAVLSSGSIHNIRFEISNVNTNRGTFTLAIRRGDDSVKRKQTLETFTGVDLDPNSPNFISKVIGDQRFQVGDDNGTKFLQLTGSYPNKSKFVTVESVIPTIDYLDENGNIRIGSASGSLPTAGSGSSNGGFVGGSDGYSGFDALGNQNGTNTNPLNFYETIDGTDTQGFDPDDLTTADGGAAYSQALDLLKNQDEYDINLILTPGLIDSVHPSMTAKVIDVCEDRGDCFAIIDPVVYAKNVADATTRAEARDSNFAAMYWPWIKVPDSQVAGTQRWVPPSVMLGGIYAFNDRVAHPWFAPAGLNRGGIDVAIQAERKLTQSQRDTLYDSNVNPIATFPGQGVTVFGQKTLQKKSSALDRINVRRLLIRVKKFIASSSRFLVFEQNTIQTRNRFLNIVNPFLERVQSQSGLNAFRVVMDDTNNTPDTIDRNQLVGQLFLQPTRTAEFIVLDFSILPTGASFPE